ncbi:carbohydrate-binding module family 18 [Trichoderma chlorosporum]
MKHFKAVVWAFALLLTKTAAIPQAVAPQAAVAADDGSCGPGLGSCEEGCCSDSGRCGTTEQYCSGSQCQLEFSDSCDTQIGPPGHSTEDIARPYYGDVPYGKIITQCVDPGLVALTFDDGPYEYTDQLLDLLEYYEVKATFFIAGNNRGKGHIDKESTGWPDVLRRMRRLGHQLASHTWTHRNLDGVSSKVQRSEMIYNEMAFRNIFGDVPTYMRPPFLECSRSSGCIDLLEDLGYHIISTNLDTKDYENDDPELIKKSKDKFFTMQSPDESSHSYIVLAHDVHYQTVVSLAKYMIETSRSRGYQLVTVGDCLGDPSENWYRSVHSKRSIDTNLGTIPPNDTELSISTNQRCGGHWGTTCKGSGFGDCCSFWGYCGRTDQYCGTGCDRSSGYCHHLSGNKDIILNTTNGLCGSAFASTCLAYGNKTCCSKYGYCGNHPEYCGAGCQDGYGNCFKY